MDKSYQNALTLMRIPFSVYLMPVFWFALSVVSGYDVWRAVVVFIILHLLVYPASNGYNSTQDKDEGSIGGLKKPPKVTRELTHLVWLFDVLAVVAGFILSTLFAGLVALYMLISKAYSYEGIRIKKYPILSTVIVTIFQGAYTFLLVQVGLNYTLQELLQLPNSGFALVSTLFLCGSYPLTQIYQHTEDSRRGDKTLSLLLGINGTFMFAAFSLLLGAAVLVYLYFSLNQWLNIFLFLICTGPVLYFFTNWVLRAQRDPKEVNFENTMQMNKISSLCMSAAFISMIVAKSFF
ncbi:UbiA family prenyltransferase [Pontibacter arcticus]|nr:UbiA family prenyltransferase [Pontibacter arcticus]